MKSSAAVLSLLWSICCYITAEAQYAFKVPDPTVPDLDESLDIVQGTVVEFIWLVNSTWQPTIDGVPILDSDGHISLWLTSWAGDSQGRFAKCLAASVYSGGGGSWAYKVDLSDSDIDNYEAQFTYRLYAPVSSVDTPYTETNEQVPSRGFIIRKASDVAASSASAAAAASSSQAAAASQSQAEAASQSQAGAASQSQEAASESQAAAASRSTTDQASATHDIATTQRTLDSTLATTTQPNDAAQTSSGTATPSNNPSSDSLSTGAKAGIAIGAVAVVLLAAIALLLFLRHRRRGPDGAAPPPVSAGPPGYVEPEKRTDAELPTQRGYEYGAELPTHRGYEYGAELPGR